MDIKRQVVEQDEHDTALRMILNYGHTLGHAIEKVTNHAVTHGHGVAMGMVLITRVGIKLGLCDRRSAAAPDSGAHPLPPPHRLRRQRAGA